MADTVTPLLATLAPIMDVEGTPVLGGGSREEGRPSVFTFFGSPGLVVMAGLDGAVPLAVLPTLAAPPS